MLVDWLRYDLVQRDTGRPERLTVRVMRIRCARVEVAHELGFAWVEPHELAPCPTSSAASTGCASRVLPEAYPLSG